MKNKYFILAIIGLFFSIVIPQNLWAQKSEYKVVFDLTSSDTTDHQSLIRWLNGIIKGNPEAQLEVVLYGKSLSLVAIGKSPLATDVQTLAKNKNISFRVCEIAMKRHQLTNADLLPGVGTVPDGIAEIVQKQQQGWGYIKAGR
ncbi:MAG TPA: DsrE family protein [Niabella sp.]|nr:DsrE family protein [Niabella sp.]HQW14259.1 DsrE family protein [Niabella sp.]HQX19659.1 DsrE family protein [Niabella sp.]HQX39907.1 DsrE family protein [Niabella sp.]HRB06900.1 DsrE family protein [Niabella sp.]